MENVLTKCLDPHKRCQSLIDGNTRQCFYEKVEGSNYCPRHGGMHANKKIEAEKVRNYKIDILRYRNRLHELADAEGVKSLREEIGILRMTLENIINSCEDDADLLMYSQKISSMCRDIERVVSTCHKLESSLGFLLDTGTVLNISNQIVQIVSNHVDDPRIMGSITNSILTLLGETTSLNEGNANPVSRSDITPVISNANITPNNPVISNPTSTPTPNDSIMSGLGITPNFMNRFGITVSDIDPNSFDEHPEDNYHHPEDDDDDELP